MTAHTLNEKATQTFLFSSSSLIVYVRYKFMNLATLEYLQKITNTKQNNLANMLVYVGTIYVSFVSASIYWVKEFKITLVYVNYAVLG